MVGVLQPVVTFRALEARRARLRFAALLVMLAVFGLATGCATRVEVTVDARHDFSGDRTWAWGSQSTRLVGDPGKVSEQLHSLTTRFVERELRSRGMTPTSDGPDLLVTSKLDVKRVLVTRHETGAVGFLASHHSSPSYEIQASTKSTSVVHVSSLQIAFSTPGPEHQVVWTGQLQRRDGGSLEQQIRAAVTQLLSRFEPRPYGAGPSPSD
jgi:hypothetical protein